MKGHEKPQRVAGSKGQQNGSLSLSLSLPVPGRNSSRSSTALMRSPGFTARLQCFSSAPRSAWELWTSPNDTKVVITWNYQSSQLLGHRKFMKIHVRCLTLLGCVPLGHRRPVFGCSFVLQVFMGKASQTGPPVLCLGCMSISSITSLISSDRNISSLVPMYLARACTLGSS